MNAERTRPLTLAERSELVANYERIGELLRAPGRSASAQEIATVDQLADHATRQHLGQALREGKDHPALNAATALLTRMAEQAEAHGLRGAARTQALVLGREIMAQSLERGEALNHVAKAYLDRVVPSRGREPGPER